MIKGTNLVSFIAILCKTLQKHEMTKGESEPSNEFSMVCRSSIALEIASMKLWHFIMGKATKNWPSWPGL